MKKIRILAAVIAVFTVLSAMSVGASAEKLTVDPGNKVDVLTDEIAYLNGPSQSDTVVDNLTDGIYAGNAGEKVYLNKSWCSKDAYPTIEEQPGTYSFNLVGGGSKTYYYTITFEELNVNCDSFSMYFNNENAYSGDDEHFPIYHIDSEFDILVSTDGGKTYSVAYSSVEFKVDTAGEVVSASGMTIENGGNCTEVKLKDAATGTVNCTYKYIEGNFDKEYKNVTNIVYAATRVRRANVTGTTTITSGAFYYAVRMTEWDVYGSKNEAEATTEEATTAAAETQAVTTAEATTAAAEVTTAAPDDATTVASDTEAPAADTTEAASGKSGCGSSVACGALVMVTILGTALLKKKD